MALDDFLKNENKSLQEQEKIKKEQQEARALADKKFKEDSQVIFDQVIKPSINKIIQTFSVNNINAQYGQKIEKVTYADNRGIVSISIEFKGSTIQLDIIGQGVRRTIDFVFKFAPNKQRGITHSFAPSEVVEEKIETLVEEQLRRV